MSHVEKLSFRIVKSLRMRGHIEVDPDALSALCYEMATEMAVSTATDFDTLAREIIDLLMRSDAVDEVYAEDDEIIPVIVHFLSRG